MRGRRPSGGKILFILILLILAIVLFNRQIRPVMESETVNQAKIRSVGIINSIVLKEISENPVSYDNLVHIDRDADGKVLSITSDVLKMNQLKSKIILDVQSGLNGSTASSVDIPLGTLLGGNLFHGRGPNLNMKVTLAGNVKADFKSYFESAGINQTRHRIYLNVGTSVYSFLPGFDATTDVNTDVLVAETVIVGSVPEVLVSSK
jgi:sporulation protein YunB